MPGCVNFVSALAYRAGTNFTKPLTSHTSCHSHLEIGAPSITLVIVGQCVVFLSNLADSRTQNPCTLLSPSPWPYSVNGSFVVAAFCRRYKIFLSFPLPPSPSLWFRVARLQFRPDSGGVRGRARAFGAILDLGGLGRRGKGGLLLDLEGGRDPADADGAVAPRPERADGRTNERAGDVNDCKFNRRRIELRFFPLLLPTVASSAFAVIPSSPQRRCCPSPQSCFGS